MSFSTYSSYIDSGVDWLGDLPSNWKLLRLKFLFNLCKRPIDESDQIVTCFRDGTVTLRANRRTEGFTNALKEIGYQGVHEGDLVIHAMDAFAGAIGVSDSDGKSSPVYSVCEPASTAVSADYYARLLRHMALSGFVSSLAKGIRERSTDFRWSDASEVALPVPSAKEQTQIARFLDYETTRIDALIEEQQRLIELLKEKHQAVISHAVTKGLDPNVPMKDSGVEWLGKIPEHWEMKRLGWICTDINDINHEMPMAVDDGVLFLSAKDLLDDGTLNFSDDVKMISEEDYERLSQKIRPKRGDIIYSRIGAALGKARLVETDVKFNVSYSCCVIRVLEKLACRQFIRYVLDGEMILTEARIRTKGIGVPDLGLGEIARFPIPLPSLKEQEQIVNYLKHEVDILTSLRAKAEQAIELLKERRSALISAAVTGKIDIRNWSAPAVKKQEPEQQETSHG